MGGPDQRPAAAALLHQRAARRDGGGRAGSLRGVLRHHRRPGLLLAQWRRSLGAPRRAPAVGGRGGSADAPVTGPAMIRVILPAHLRTLARVNGEGKVAVAGPVTTRAILEAQWDAHSTVCYPRARPQAAAPVPPLLRLLAGSVPRCPRYAASVRGRVGGRALHG